MKHIPLHKILGVLSTLLMVNMLMTGCNAKSEDEEPENQPSISVAVRSFKLNPNARVLANLDSVFFSIDLDRGIIFNADSLPKGTDIEKLVPVITFPSTVETAEIIMEGGNRMEGVVNYKTNPSDTIDFSGRVTLRLTANKGALSRDYQIRVNVHNAVADSIMWDKLASSALPSRLAGPKAQKTVTKDGTIYTLIEENNATYTLSATRDVASAIWTKKAVSLPGPVSITSFTATEDALYILSQSGDLLTSVDGEAWSSTGVNWVHIIGGYGKSLLGISQDNSGAYMHDMYPAESDFVRKPIAKDFPTSATSNLMTFASKWTSEPYAWFTGGVRDGKTLAATWSYDGATWARTSNSPLPALSDALLVPYFVYRKTSTSWIQTEYSVTLCIGGKMSDGNMSRKVYLSYDSGVNWTEASALMQLPKSVPSLYDADAVIATTPMQASIDAWATTTTPQLVGARVHYFVDGSQVEWDCPYIYMFGGYKADGTLSAEIWRGVLARLTFAPLF